MARMAAERIDWIVVFDGAKALLFENEGFSDAPDFKLLEKDEIDNPPDRELKTDAPGRSADNGHGQRSAMDETDFHEQQERRFVKRVAESLNHSAMENKFDRLYVFGATSSLGTFRDNLHEKVTEKIAREVHGDYVNHPVKKLEERFKKELAPPKEDFEIPGG